MLARAMAAMETALSGPVSQHFHPGPAGVGSRGWPPCFDWKSGPLRLSPPRGAPRTSLNCGGRFPGVWVLSGPSQNWQPVVWRPWKPPFPGQLASIFTRGPMGVQSKGWPPCFDWKIGPRRLRCPWGAPRTSMTGGGQFPGVRALSGRPETGHPWWRSWKPPFPGLLASIFTRGPPGFEAGVVLLL